MVNCQTGSGKFVVAVHHTNLNVMAALANYGFSAGGRDLYVPYINKSNGWIVSLNIQNLDNATPADILVRYYDTNGGFVTDFSIDDLLPGRTSEIQSSIPTSFTGSVWIHSFNANVVVAVHQAHTDGRNYGYSVP